MNIDQIEILKIEDCREILENRLDLYYDGVSIADDEELEAELVLYKIELVFAEEARLAEIARVEAMKVRFSAISDLRLSMHRIGDQTPNMALFELDIISTNNVALLEALEVADSANQAEIAAELPMKNRAAEYAKLDVMLLEAIAEQAAGRPEKMEEYLVLRNQIKLDNPK
jgi:hypothetical protein